jgi:hypothetical protein
MSDNNALSGSDRSVESEDRNADMTDDEWLNTYCKKLLNALTFKAAFKRDAILYRRLSAALVKFRSSSKRPLFEAKKPGENGQWYANVYRVVRAAHPMHWFICDGCNGTGHKPEAREQPCTKCFGGGFKLKFEER